MSATSRAKLKATSAAYRVQRVFQAAILSFTQVRMSEAAAENV